MDHLLLIYFKENIQAAFRSAFQGIPEGFSSSATPAPVVTATPDDPADAPESVQERDIPGLVKELYLGVPAGNGYQPSRIAVDSQRHRVYTLNKGFDDEGNTISVLDTQTGQITALLKLSPQAFYPQDVLIDPYRPRLYALWRGSSNAEVASGLSIIDTKTLTVTQIITDVMTILPGPDRLYLANQTRLWVVEPDNLTELSDHKWELSQATGKLLLNSEANRLYFFQQTGPGRLEVYTADTLEPVSNYAVEGTLLDAVVDPDNERVVMLVSAPDKQRTLQVLDVNGQPLPYPKWVVLEHDLYSPSLAFDGRVLYITVNDEKYTISAFTLPDLTLIETLHLPYTAGDLGIDPVTGRFYSTYAGSSTGDGQYILEVDPATGTTKPIYTYLSVTDALTDPATDRLYLLNERGTVKVLRLSNLAQIGQVETGFQPDPRRYVGTGHLSLDPQRNLLYIDGEQLRIVDTVSLTVTHHLDEWAGQITPDSTGDRLYYTPRDCGTLILNADTFTGTELVFPDGSTEPPPPLWYCFYATHLDVANQMLYGQSPHCGGGSSCGGNGFTSVYDVSGSPRFLGNISGVPVAFDPTHQRAFTYKRTSDNAIFITRVERQGQAITETMRVFGVSFSDRSFYDPLADRLYSSNAVFDGDLAMLAPIYIPGSLLAFDLERRHLYFSHRGSLLIAVTQGGHLELPPPPNPADKQYLSSKLFTAANETHFRLDTANKFDSYSRLYRSGDGGKTWTMVGHGLPGSLEISALAISPDFEQNPILLAGMTQHYSGGGGQSGGGLYRSTDGGDTWWPATRGLDSLRITGITFSPTFSHDHTIFLSATAPNQSSEEKFRSTDDGQSWTKLN